jgi:malonyl CoA-acyl carrier protein transacylase
MSDQPTTAVLFPGQGSQQPGMREAAEATRPDLVALACELCGDDPFARAEEATAFQQPALYCAAYAAWERLAGERPIAMAGHSLGEITALSAAGVIRPEDGLRLVVARGRLMQDAADCSEGGMLAVRGTRDAVEPLLIGSGVVVANENSLRQVVLAGQSKGLDRVQWRLEREGIRGTRLPVAGAFHSPQMAPAVAALREQLARVTLYAPRVRVFSGVTARPFGDVRGLLAEALTRPVRWVEVLLALREQGVGRFVETGPGSVLTGLVRRTLDDVEAVSATAAEPARA